MHQVKIVKDRTIGFFKLLDTVPKVGDVVNGEAVIKQMLDRINQEIADTMHLIEIGCYEDRSEDTFRERCKIDGMISMLKIATGKEYSYDKYGIYENR